VKLTAGGATPSDHLAGVVDSPSIASVLGQKFCTIPGYLGLFVPGRPYSKIG